MIDGGGWMIDGGGYEAMDDAIEKDWRSYHMGYASH
jgi:hypothetical protein